MTVTREIGEIARNIPHLKGAKGMLAIGVIGGIKKWTCITAHTAQIGWEPGAPGVYLWREIK